MKKIILITSLFTLSLIIAGCNPEPTYYYDDIPPSPPKNVEVYNGDNRVDITWAHNRESDIAGYNVYYAYSYDGKYTLIGSTSDNYFIDYDASNGVTYYYGIAAYDYSGNESALSPDVIYSTPRPEGFNQSIFDYLRFPYNGGYSFTTYSAVPYDDLEADFFFEYYDGVHYLNVWDDTDIRDMGSTRDIYDILYAPTSGWAPDKYEIVVPGHTYVIWTWDNHFAKIRVSSVTRERVVFDWAFQLVKGERQLKEVKQSSTRVLERTERKNSVKDKGVE
jgi:hypothetical protein